MLVPRVAHIAGCSVFSSTCSIAVVKGQSATMYLINDVGYWRKRGGTRLACSGGADCFRHIYRKVRKDAEAAKKKFLNRSGGPFGGHHAIISIVAFLRQRQGPVIKKPFFAISASRRSLR